jgi:hypothetical protein
LILAQGAHSIEEYVFRLYEVFAPARFVAGLVGLDLATGFLISNGALLLFGLWCYFARVRPRHRSARAYAWFWAVLETANGFGHIGLAVASGGYFPGLATAPLLLGPSLYLLWLLTTNRALQTFGKRA